MNYNIFAYQQRLLGKVFKMVPLNGKETLLDIGCGDGVFTRLISKHVGLILGVDMVPSSNWKKIKVRNVQFIVADACNLPFINECFDIVFEKDALHHIKDYWKVLKEIVRVMRREGTAIFIEANRYNPILYFHMTLMKHHEHFTKKYFETLLLTAFRKCYFMSIESHVYPIKTKYILKLIYILEDSLSKIPFLKNYLAYNIAIAKNGNQGY